MDLTGTDASRVIKDILLARRRNLRASAHSVLPPASDIEAHQSNTSTISDKWCSVCQQARGRTGQHRRQHQEENISIIQRRPHLHVTTLMYLHNVLADNTPTPFLRHWRQQQGLCAEMLTSKKGYTPHQAAQLHQWAVKHGFAKSILQSDAETSLMQLVNTVAADLNLPARVSPPSLFTSVSRED